MHSSAPQGGTIATTGDLSATIYNFGKFVVEGGKVTASATNSVAIYNDNEEGTVTISGEQTMVNSAITQMASDKTWLGTIIMFGVPDKPKTVLDIKGGTVTNDKGTDYYSVYFENGNINTDNVSQYYICAKEAKVGKVYPVAADFVAVTDITDVPTTAIINGYLYLSGKVVPAGASNNYIDWSVVDAGTTGATISNGKNLNTTAAGTVKVLATIKNGKTEKTDFTKEFNITVSVAPPVSGGSSGGGGSSSSTPKVSDKVINNPVGSKGAANNLTQSIKNAIAAGKTNATTDISFANYTKLTVDGLKAINDAGTKATAGKNVKLDIKVKFDKQVGKQVISRISVDPVKLAATMTKDLPLNVWIDQQKDSKVTAVNKLFEKNFKNKLVTVTFEQKTPLAVDMEFAAKLDLSSLNTKTLYVYSYNPMTGIYTQVKAPNVWMDKNGYAHLTAPLGGSVLITDSPLTKK